MNNYELCGYVPCMKLRPHMGEGMGFNMLLQVEVMM